MSKSWSNFREEWLKLTSASEDDANWALEALLNDEKDFFEIERKIINNENIYTEMRDLKRKVKDNIALKENSLDDISLNNSNSHKLQISIPSNLNYLLKVWAAAEGRDLSSVALQCLESGLRDMTSRGSIPEIAINRYNSACEKRIALAEINNLLEKFELYQKGVN